MPDMRSTLTLTQRPSIHAAAEPSHRDATIDAVRAACLFVVVVLHALMVGVETAPDGSLLASVALEGETWFTPVTWLLQIMPLFFIAGGFASLSQWRRMRARGAGATAYIAARVQRLAVPAVIMIIAVGGALLLARALGADPALIDEASLRIGQPLWFLAVYIGVTALVPSLSWLHDRYRVVTILMLGIGVVAVDLAHARLGLPIGYLNLALVWTLMQQLGFALLDGVCANWSRKQLFSGMATALTLLFVLIACGWSADMLFNLNPPTTAIVLLGTTQFFALHLLRPRLDAATRDPLVARVAKAAGPRAMGVYLWHMPIILTLVAVLWGVGLPLPEPHSAAWWATRVPWLIGIAVCVLPFASLIARGERRVLLVLARMAPSLRFTVRTRSIASAFGVPLAISGTASALLFGIASPLQVLSAVLLLAAGVALAMVADGERDRRTHVETHRSRYAVGA